MNAMLFEVHSMKTLDDIEKGLHEAAAMQKFGVLTVHDLRATLSKKGVELSREVRVYEVCNPQQAKKVLDANPSISTALPCRIAVFATDNGNTLSMIRPTEMMKGFDTPGIESVAEEVEQAMKTMMQDAAG
jgi:uncharacterized protein (DUF302 family)